MSDVLPRAGACKELTGTNFMHTVFFRGLLVIGLCWVIALGADAGLARAGAMDDPAGSVAPAAPASPPTPPAAEGGKSAPAGQGQGQGRGRRATPSPGVVNVEASMKSMSRALRQLREQVEKPEKKDENLRLIGQMQEDCVASKNAGVPAKQMKLAKDDAERAKLPELYRRGLIDVLKALTDLELCVLEDRAEDAKKACDTLLQLRHMGHQDMGVDD